MRIFRTIIGYAFAALACFGFGYSGLALASDHRVETAANFVLASAGDFGAKAAKFEAVQAYMLSEGDGRTSSSASLARQSNGFVQTVLVTESGAESRTGIGAGLTST